MTNLADMSVPEAADKAIELILYGQYAEDVRGKYEWREPYSGTFEEYLKENYSRELDYDDESNELSQVDFSSPSVWQELMDASLEGSRDGWHGKVVSEYGGEGMGDQYWMVVSVSDGETTRFFRRDGWYASYTGGELDGDIYEVAPKEKLVTFYE